MKLECSVVKDLYVLYKDNELSNEVREAVEKHLEKCDQCKEVYQEGVNFTDLIRDDQEVEPSRRFDERIMLRLKIARLKVGVIFLIVILLISTYFSYSQTRYNLLYDVSHAMERIHHLDLQVRDINNKLSSPDNYVKHGFIDELNEQGKLIRRDLNFFEERALQKAPNDLFINFSLSRLTEILRLRYLHETNSARDDKAFNQLKGYTEKALILMEDERDSLNRLHGGILQKIRLLADPMNIKEISENYDNINQLALIYTKYDKFPEELEPMSSQELENRIRYLFDIDDMQIELRTYMDRSIRLDGTCEFDAYSEGGPDFYGTIDAYSGRLQSVFYRDRTFEGELLPVERVQNNMLEFIKRDFDHEEFDVDYLGINYRFNSNQDVKLYSFRVYPIYEGYRVNVPFIIYFNARSGHIYHLIRTITDYTFIKPDYQIDKNIIVTPEEGLKSLNAEGDYDFNDTLIIKSKLTGKYVLVHMYKDDHREIYVNTITGKQDFSY